MVCLTENDLLLDNSRQVSTILEILYFEVASSMNIKIVDSYSNLNLKGRQNKIDEDFGFLQITVRVSQT